MYSLSMCVCVGWLLWLYGAISLIRFIPSLFLWQKTSSASSQENEKENEEAIEKMRLSHLQANILNFPLHSKRFGFMLSQVEQMSSEWTKSDGQKCILTVFFFDLSLSLQMLLSNSSSFKLYWFFIPVIEFALPVSYVYPDHCVHSAEKKASHF